MKIQNLIRIISFSIIIIFIASQAQSSAVYGNEKKNIEKRKIAIFDFIANNVPKAYSRIVRNAIEVSLYATNYFQLIERERINKLLKERNIRKISIKDTSGIVSLGKSLSTDFIIVGSLDKIEDYKIVIRIVSVKEGKILIAYSKNFSSAGDIDTIAEKLSVRASDDLKKYIESGKIKAEFYDLHNIILGVKFNYIYPVRNFSKLVNSGFGFTVEGGIDNIIVDNLAIGLEFGYHHFSGKDNRSDDVNFIHLLFNLGYRVYPIRRFYIYPTFSFGISFINIIHGSGSGFDMAENSEKTLIEPMLTAGLDFGFVPVKLVHIVFGFKYGVVFEPKGVMDYIVFNIGTVFVF